MTKLLKRRSANRVLRWFADESDSAKPNASEFSRILREIRPGDVLLVEGQSFFSGLIQLFTRSRWTHCALYIGYSPKVLKHPHSRICAKSDSHSKDAWLVEANLGEGVVASPLEKYARHNVRICRPKELSTTARQKVIMNAIAYLDGKYDLLLILRLAAFLLARWVFPFNTDRHCHPVWGTSTRVICTGLIWRAFDPVRFVCPFWDRFTPDQHRLQRGTTLLAPNIFLQSPNFQVVKTPGFLADTGHVAA